MNAVIFQNMPPLSLEEYTALEQSIRENGVQVPILVDENGTVIDGHHRQKITQHLGIECPSRTVLNKSEAEKRTLALSLNLDRRHLSREQRRALIAESLKADPEMSNNAHAKRTGVSDKTVGSVRDELEANSEIPNSVERITADGKPAPGPKPVAKVTEATKTEAYVDSDTGEVIEPPARPEPTGPRRKPLRDGFRDAALDLDKLVHRFERLVNDDRFPKNKDEVTRYRNDLVRANEALQRLIDQF